MASTPPKLTSRSFKAQKALVGKQYRTGVLGRALNDIYGDIDTAFVELEAEITGLDWKNAVQAASTGNLTLSGAQTIDGVAVVADDRVLAKDQTTGAENGIWVVAAAAWARAEDFNANAEVTNSAAVPVEDGGTTNGGTRWRLTNTGAITVGTTALTFAAYGSSSADAIAAVEGEATLDLTGALTVDLTLDVTGNITTSGTVDGVDIAAVSLSSMPTAATGDIACGNQDLTGVSGIAADGGSTFTILCQTGQGAELTASTGTKVSWNQTGVSFFGAAAVDQPADTGALTDNSGGAGANGTIEAVTDVATAAAAVKELATKVNAIRDVLRELGLMA